MEEIEQILREKTFKQLSNEEKILLQELFDDEESYTAYRKFILELDENEELEFPEEIDTVIYAKLHKEEKQILPFASILRYAALALLFLGLGFASAWLFKPAIPTEIISETIIQTDTIRVIQTEKTIDTFFVQKTTVEIQEVEVLVYVEDNSAYNTADSMMLFADSVAWKNDAIVLNNSLENREDLNVFFTE